MRRVVRNIIVLTIIMVWAGQVIAQTQSPSTIQPDKTVGAAEVYYFKEKNKTRAQVRIYLVGKAEDIVRNRETLSMDVIFEVDGPKVTKPKSVSIAFSAYSPSKSKYTGNHELFIHIDGLEGFSSTRLHTRLLSSAQSPSGGTLEIFLTPAIDFNKFLRMSTAHLVTILWGGTYVLLKREDIKALNDLARSVEEK